MYQENNYSSCEFTIIQLTALFIIHSNENAKKNDDGDDDKYSWSPEELLYFHAKENDSIANHAAWYAFGSSNNQLQGGKTADNVVNVFC